jgi:hypothetical protein
MARFVSESNTPLKTCGRRRTGKNSPPKNENLNQIRSPKQLPKVCSFLVPVNPKQLCANAKMDTKKVSKKTPPK